MAVYQSFANVCNFYTYDSASLASPVLAISLTELVNTAFKGDAKTGFTATFDQQKNDPAFAKFLDTYKAAVSGSSPESWYYGNGVQGGGSTTTPSLFMVWFGGVSDGLRQIMCAPVSITENTGDFTAEFNKSAKRSFEVKSVAPPSALALGTTAATAAILFTDNGTNSYGKLITGSDAAATGAAVFTDSPTGSQVAMPANRTIPTTRHGYELWITKGSILTY